eukprot:10574413-Alexandrium_andersonii.AAC.1
MQGSENDSGRGKGPTPRTASCKRVRYRAHSDSASILRGVLRVRATIQSTVATHGRDMGRAWVGQGQDKHRTGRA